ncbi:hypothetical protein PFISCL1PPCAC_2777, partial [Pristionchus fissidentatus]
FLFKVMPTLWILVFLLRRAVLLLLDSQISKLSEKAKRMQKALVQTVTVHAALSSLILYPSAIFFYGQIASIHDVNFLDSCFFFIQLHCTIAPLVTIYYVPHYRR